MCDLSSGETLGFCVVRAEYYYYYSRVVVVVVVCARVDLT